MTQALVTQSPARQLIAKWHTALDLRVRASEMSKDTANVYRVGVDRFVDYIEEDGLAVTPDTLRGWKAEMLGRYSAGSVNTWFAGVKAFYAWAVEAGMTKVNPAEGVKGASRVGANKRHKREVITNDEMKRILALQLSDRDRCLLHLKAFTGVRDIELHRADVGDIGTEHGEIVLRVQGKGRREKDEIVVLSNELARAALHLWLIERGDKPGPLFTSDKAHRTRMSRRTIRYIVKGAMRAAGVVGNKTSHSFRHAAATNLLLNGGTLQQAQAMLRHANIATTGIYLHELNRVTNAGEKLISYE